MGGRENRTGNRSSNCSARPLASVRADMVASTTTRAPGRTPACSNDSSAWMTRCEKLACKWWPAGNPSQRCTEEKREHETPGYGEEGLLHTQDWRASRNPPGCAQRQSFQRYDPGVSKRGKGTPTSLYESSTKVTRDSPTLLTFSCLPGVPKKKKHFRNLFLSAYVLAYQVV